LIRAALRDDVDDATGRLAEFRFIAAGFDLDFLDEIVRRRIAERAEDDRIGAEAAIAGVRDVRAVNDVLILEAGAARD
jgi:hypothetical protein